MNSGYHVTLLTMYTKYSFQYSIVRITNWTLSFSLHHNYLYNLYINAYRSEQRVCVFVVCWRVPLIKRGNMTAERVDKQRPPAQTLTLRRS